ncbi:hypothetical protein FRC01_010885, partial [Tulasnella sp. 417]
SITTAANRTIMLLQTPDREEERRWKEIWRTEVGEFTEPYARGPVDAYNQFLRMAIRPAESTNYLQIIALRRVICTSEDPKALIYSAVNLQVIRDPSALSSLAKDVEFRTRLSGLYQAALDDSLQGQTKGRDSSGEARVFSAAFSHLLIITEGFNDSVPTNFDAAYKGAVEGLKKPEALKLGCVVASVILSSKLWSESEMVQMIFAALPTASTSWRRKPDHEIYVRLLELCLVSGEDTIPAAYYQEILGDMDAHLLSIEEWVREKGASETDRQHGRDLQDRYILSVAPFFAADSFPFR